MIEQVAPGIKRITYDDSRWYWRDGERYPSVTWVTKHWPKGSNLERWLVQFENLHQRDAALEAAARRGSRVHWALEQLALGHEVSIDGIPAGYDLPFSKTINEWQMVIAGWNWFQYFRPTIISVEQNVFGASPNYAGTVDLICEIDIGLISCYQAGYTSRMKPKESGEKVRCIVDWKTSSGIYDTHEIQVAAYAYADYGYEAGGKQNGLFTEDDVIPRAFVCRVGSRHKQGFEFKEVEDKRLRFEQFVTCYKLWEYLNGDTEERFVDVPESLCLSTT